MQQLRFYSPQWSKAIAENKNAIVAFCWTYFTNIKHDARNHKYKKKRSLVCAVLLLRYRNIRVCSDYLSNPRQAVFYSEQLKWACVGRNIPKMTKRTSRVHSVTQLKLLSTCATAGGRSAKLQTHGYLFLQGCGGGEKAVAVTGLGCHRWKHLDIRTFRPRNIFIRFHIIIR